MLKGVFITGTGTDVGKSIVTATLLRALWLWHSNTFKGFLALKPVQTGTIQHAQTNIQHINADSNLYHSALHGLNDITVPQEFLPQTLHHFALAASPHLASVQENFKLSVNKLCLEINELSIKIKHEPLLIEGAGGLCVPLNQSETTLDLIDELQLPVVIVINNTLGALNHSLMTIDILQKRGLTIAALVCTEVENNPDYSLIKQDNIDFLRQHISQIPIYTLPFFQEFNAVFQISDFSIWDKAASCLAPLAKQMIKHWQSTSVQNLSAITELLNFDKKHLWHPYTSVNKPLPVYAVSHAKEMHIYLQGRKKPLIDGMSSWWCAVHGYGNKHLLQAAQKQAASMSHVMFGGLTHEPAIQAAQKVLNLMQHDKANKKPLSRLFWSDSGSVAVEVALKMALQYHQGRGEKQRTYFLSPRGGYYGDTFGAMSVCDPVNGMHTLFNNVLAKHIFIPRPDCAFDGTEQNNFDLSCLIPLEKAFEKYADRLAAVIIEPIVQGAGGMWFYDPRYLNRLHELCTTNNVLLIFDEIATGFGRSGKMFAAHWSKANADICCIGKALTGGFLSLAATICTEDVAQGICANNQVFMHGPTFMGNALACAVAQASLDIFAQGTWESQVLRIEKELKKGLAACTNLKGVHQVRVLGAIGVVEMQENVNIAALQAFFVENGVWIRPFAKLIYIMPPYIASTQDIEHLTSVITNAIVLELYK